MAYMPASSVRIEPLAPARRAGFAWQHGLPRLLPFALPLFVLIAWQLAAQQGWMPAQILPAPKLVAGTFADLASNGDITTSLLVSLHRIARGFALGAGIGFGLGVLLGSSARARACLEPTLRALFAIPTLGWIPILILVFGIDEALKVLIIAKAVLVPITLSTAQGIRNVPVAYLEAAQALRLTRWTRFTRLTVPASLPSIFSGIRLGLGHAFTALVVVEMLAGSDGIGYTMVWGRTLFQIDIVIVGMVMVGVIGFALDAALRRLERRFSRWVPADE